MPAGDLLSDRVATLLSADDAKTVSQIARDIKPPVSNRAVRYAIDILIGKGRAKRLGHKNQHYRVVAVERLRDASA